MEPYGLAQMLWPVPYLTLAEKKPWKASDYARLKSEQSPSRNKPDHPKKKMGERDAFTVNIGKGWDIVIVYNSIIRRLKSYKDLKNETSKIVEKFSTEHLMDGWNNISIDDIGIFHSWNFQIREVLKSSFR